MFNKSLFFALLMLFDFGVSFSQSINIDIDYAHPGVTIPEDFTGLSFETRALVKDNSLSPDNTALQNLVKLLGTGVFRIGGNSVQNSVFTFNKRSKKTGQDTITADDIDRAFDFANKIGWKVIFGLNQGKYNPQMAATEAQYAWKYKSQIHSFEIGNEPNHFTMHNTRDSSWGYPEFRTEWETYAKTIKEAVPDAPFSGPVTASNPKPWFFDFVKDESKNVIELSHHNYTAAPEKGTIAQLLSKKQMATSADLFNSLVSASAAQNNKFRLAECNSIHHGGLAGVSDAFASALWVTDYMFTLAQSGAVGINIHTGATNPYTPISYGKGVFIPKPIYYGMLLFRLGGTGSLLPVKVSDKVANVSSFAVKDPSGEVTCTLINKDTLINYSCVIACNGLSKSKTVNVIRLMAPSVSATSGVTLGGESVTNEGIWSPKTVEQINADEKGNFVVAVPAGSAASIHFVK